MNLSLYISTFLSCCFFVLPLTKDAETSHVICGYTYKNKNNGDLFQGSRRLSINCDATFTWKHISCTQRDTCYGTWSIVKGTICLTTDKKFKKFIEQQTFPESFEKYTDLSNTTLTVNDSSIIWQRAADWIDTLYRNY